MFANIRRHQKWLWILISGAVIISFVVFMQQGQRGQGGQSNPTVGSINGRPLLRNEYFNAKNEAEIRYFLTSGSWHGSDEFSRQNEGLIARDTRERLIFKELLKQQNIHVTDEEIVNWISENLGRERDFTAVEYTNFIERVLAPKGLKRQDFERFVSTQVGIVHLLNVAGTPGRLVTPQEAEAQFRRENEQVTGEAVFFHATNYLAQVTTNDVAIANYFTNQMARYRIPDRVQLSYVEFPASNYFAQADVKIAGMTNLSQQIEEAYARGGKDFYRGTNGVPLPPEEAKEKIRANHREGMALVEAQRAAVEFMEELLNIPGPKQVSNLDALAAKKGITLKVTEPFTMADGPAAMESGLPVGEMAFSLTPQEPFLEQPIRGQESVFVAGLKDRLPSKFPPLEEVRNRVLSDYLKDQSRELMEQAGRLFHQQLTNVMAGGKSFTNGVSEMGQKPVAIGPFGQTSSVIPGLDPGVSSSSIKSLTLSLKEGETSSFMAPGDHGFIVHLSKTIPASDDLVKTGLPDYLKRLQRAGAGEAFQEWVNRQAQTINLTFVTDKSEGAETQTP